MKFSCETKNEIPLPPEYTFPQAFNYLNKDKSSFYVLEDEEIGYVQCAGEKLKCCVEYRDKKLNKQFRLAKGDENGNYTQIEMSNGHVKVRVDEVLTIDDAIIIFKEFYVHKRIPGNYRMNNLNEQFYS